MDLCFGSLRSGMVLTAFDEDIDDDRNADDLFATGTVIPSPEFARCNGSKWFLEIDENGVRHESDMRHNA